MELSYHFPRGGECGDSATIRIEGLSRSLYCLIGICGGGAVALAPAALADPPDLCSGTISSDVTFTSNVTCPAGSSVSVAGATVDLAGFSWVVDMGVRISGVGSRVTNGTLSSAALQPGARLDHVTVGGIAERGMPPADATVPVTLIDHVTTKGINLQEIFNVTIDHATIAGGTGFSAVSLGPNADNVTIKYSHISGGTTAAIGGTQISDLTLFNNVISGSAQTGISSGMGPLGWNVRGNTITGHQVGIDIFDTWGGSVVANNLVSGNGTGIYAGHGGENRFGPDLITGNLVMNNSSTGILVGPSAVTHLHTADVVSNAVVSNGRSATSADGITVTPSTDTVKVTGNAALINGGHGINAPTAADGGHNVALGNRTLPQCIGVRCALR